MAEMGCHSAVCGSKKKRGDPKFVFREVKSLGIAAAAAAAAARTCVSPASHLHYVEEAPGDRMPSRCGEGGGRAKPKAEGRKPVGGAG